MKQSAITHQDIPDQAEIARYLHVAQELRSRELRRQISNLFNAPRKLFGKVQSQEVSETAQEERKGAAA